MRSTQAATGLTILLVLAGCGKSADQSAIHDKEVANRAAAAAQAELDADQEKFRRMATGAELAAGTPRS